MKTAFRLTSVLARQLREDLLRPHPFALERVGFISARPAMAGPDLSLLAAAYHPVADEDYLDDATVGAMIGPAAIRKALQIAYKQGVSMLHVHMHEHAGPPRFSRVDLREYPKFVPDFFNVQPGLPHGAILLSRNEITGLLWLQHGSSAVPLDEAIEVGAPFRFFGRA
jgi:hypothetical protein